MGITMHLSHSNTSKPAIWGLRAPSAARPGSPRPLPSHTCCIISSLHFTRPEVLVPPSQPVCPPSWLRASRGTQWPWPQTQKSLLTPFCQTPPSPRHVLSWEAGVGVGGLTEKGPRAESERSLPSSSVQTPRLQITQPRVGGRAGWGADRGRRVTRADRRPPALPPRPHSGRMPLWPLFHK